MLKIFIGDLSPEVRAKDIVNYFERECGFSANEIEVSLMHGKRRASSGCIGALAVFRKEMTMDELFKRVGRAVNIEAGRTACLKAWMGRSMSRVPSISRRRSRSPSATVRSSSPQSQSLAPIKSSQGEENGVFATPRLQEIVIPKPNRLPSAALKPISPPKPQISTPLISSQLLKVPAQAPSLDFMNIMATLTTVINKNNESIQKQQEVIRQLSKPLNTN